jgi:hypothetical protein
MTIPVSFVLEDLAGMPKHVGNAAHQYMQAAMMRFSSNASYEIEDTEPYDGDVIPTVVIEEDGTVDFTT